MSWATVRSFVLVCCDCFTRKSNASSAPHRIDPMMIPFACSMTACEAMDSLSCSPNDRASQYAWALASTIDACDANSRRGLDVFAVVGELICGVQVHGTERRTTDREGQRESVL